MTQRKRFNPRLLKTDRLPSAPAAGDLYLTRTGLYQGSELVVSRGQSRRAMGGGVFNAYRAAIAAAGGTISSLHLDALDRYLGDLVASSAWPKILELHLPLGEDWLAAMVKLKYPSGNPSSLTNANAVTTAEADYKVRAGVKFVGNTNKKLLTGFNPRTVFGNNAGFAWGMGVFTTSLTWAGIPMGAETNAELYIGNGGTSNLSSTINNKNGSAGFPAANNGAIAHGGWRAVQYGADGLGRNWIGGCGEMTFSGTSPAAPANSQIALASCNNGFWSDATLQGYAIFTELTQVEMQTLAQFFINVNEAVGRDAYRKELDACGTSITAGTGATNAATDRYSAITAARYGLLDSNHGQSGSRIGSQIPDITNFSVFNNCLQHLLGRQPLHWSMEHGINDISQAEDIDGMLADYDRVLTWAKQSNIIMENGTLCGPSWIDYGPYMQVYPASLYTPERHRRYTAGVRKLAEKFGTKFCDFGTGRMANQAGVFDSSWLHPNTYGYSLLAEDFKAAIQP